MTLIEIVDKIVQSDAFEWHTMGCDYDKPSYRNHYEAEEEPSKGKYTLRVTSQSAVAAFIPDPAITLAWGLEIEEKYAADWVERFPDHSASLHIADVFFYGGLVFRVSYVYVDGARAVLPAPASTDLTVPRNYSRFVRLLDRLNREMTDFDDYFRRAGLKETPTSWPPFRKS